MVGLNRNTLSLIVTAIIRLQTRISSKTETIKSITKRSEAFRAFKAFDALWSKT